MCRVQKRSVYPCSTENCLLLWRPATKQPGGNSSKEPRAPPWDNWTKPENSSPRRRAWLRLITRNCRVNSRLDTAHGTFGKVRPPQPKQLTRKHSSLPANKKTHPWKRRHLAT